MTDYIQFGDKSYPVRELRLNNYEVTVRISCESLESAVLDADGNFTSREAQLIDELIFFYVPDDLINCESDEEVEQYIYDNLEW